MSDPTISTCVGAFHATYAVLKAEKFLKTRGIAVKLIPVPRQISSNCGISIRFDCRELDLVMEVISDLGEDLEGIFRQDEQGFFMKIIP